MRLRLIAITVLITAIAPAAPAEAHHGFIGFQLGARRSLALWGDAARPPIGARVAGAIAIVGWIGTVIAARLIAFT